MMMLSIFVLIGMMLNVISQFGFYYLDKDKNNKPIQILVEPNEKQNTKST